MSADWRGGAMSQSHHQQWWKTRSWLRGEYVRPPRRGWPGLTPYRRRLADRIHAVPLIQDQSDSFTLSSPVRFCLHAAKLMAAVSNWSDEESLLSDCGERRGRGNLGTMRMVFVNLFSCVGTWRIYMWVALNFGGHGIREWFGLRPGPWLYWTWFSLGMFICVYEIILVKRYDFVTLADVKDSEKAEQPAVKDIKPLEGLKIQEMKMRVGIPSIHHNVENSETNTIIRYKSLHVLLVIVISCLPWNDNHQI